MGDPIAVRTIVREIVVERLMTGDQEIWARHAEMPDLDRRLATLHYSYAYQDNARISDNAAAVAALYRGDTSSAIATTTPTKGR